MDSQHDNLSGTSSRARWLAALSVLLLLFAASADSFAEDEADAAKHFADSVLPLLKQHCYECHSHDADAVEGGLVLDSRAGWKVGGDSGPAIAPGRPESSLLLTAVGYSNTELQMPPDGKLSPSDIEVLRTWIAGGAYDPRVAELRAPATGDQPQAVASDLWSLRPVEAAEVPNVGDDSWVRNDIDRFILAKLSERGMSPNEAVDAYALLRRATFDLTGLPPTLDEIDAFINDDRGDAYERLVERLLDSPHYGERWGRHWLDLARYGDSNGGDINYAHANAWRYRDYVIQSLNDDKPYDLFIREQLAGDLMPDDGDAERRRELLTATGFLMLGPKMLAEVDTDKLQIDIVDEQLDVTGLTFLGMTFGCARCHDHKFDPITTDDYYAMAGIFRSTKVIDVLRPSNGVSEWLEIDVTPAETLATIEGLNNERERLQQMLVELGGAATGQSSDANAASKAIRATALPPLRSTTWSAWVRIHTRQNLGGVISATYEGANQGHSLGFDRGNTPRVVWNHGSRPHTIIAASKPISFGQWHHMALTFDAAAQQLQLYVDGSVAAAASNVATTEFSTIGVGRREASRQFQFIGDVDEVQIYAEAFNESQIQDLFEKRAPTVSPLLHWSFDRCRTDAVIDAGKGGFDGRLVGMSIDRGIIADGAVGEAFSFNALKEAVKPDAERDRKIAELKEQIQRLEVKMPLATQVMAVAATTPVDLAIHLRGSHLKLAATPTPRGTPKVFEHALPPVAVPPDENGRLQLANWIASPSNPLTARVMVNRIWQHHFGEGLVRTSSNFGTRGEHPSHPELLDWLANEFVASGWSIKQMHRLIMNSATYRMSSRINAEAAKRDPENRLLARYPVRRLEAEAIRDSLLAVTGELDRTVGGTLFKSPNKQRVTMSPDDPAYDSPRRSIYLPSVRVRSYEMLSIFDVSDNGQHVDVRPQTMVAQQALFLMNNPLVIQQAKALAERVAQQTGSFEEQVDWLHRLLYARAATDSEISTLALVFTELSASEAAEQTSDNDATAFAWQHIIHTMICANAFIYLQ